MHRLFSASLDVLCTHCCGLDIHKKTGVACLITSTEGSESVKETRTFRTLSGERVSVEIDQCLTTERPLFSQEYPLWFSKTQLISEKERGST